MDSWGEFREQITERLNTVRPERASHDDKDWREPVYGWARNHIPDESNIIRYFAEKEVDAVEARATRQGNKLLRQWAKGQRPLIWSDLGPLPVIVEKVRIRLDAVGPDDIEDAARELEVAAKATFDEVVLLGLCLRDLARMARRQGLDRVAQLGDLDPRITDDGVLPRDYEEDDYDDEDES